MKDYFENLVLSRQSCRDFNDKPLEKEKVDKIVQLATLSPSACNSQPWKMYVITDQDKLGAVAESLQDRGHNLFTSGAKAFIVLAEKDATLKETISSRFSSDHFVKYDIGELTAYITLAAESMGVSSCIIGWVNQEKLKSAVGLADGEIANIVVALGYSDIPVRAKKRKTAEEIIVNV